MIVRLNREHDPMEGYNFYSKVVLLKVHSEIDISEAMH